MSEPTVIVQAETIGVVVQPAATPVTVSLATTPVTVQEQQVAVTVAPEVVALTVAPAIELVGGDKFYRHTQDVPAAIWLITHALAKYPAVSVVDSAGSWVVGDVEYLDQDSLRAVFSGAFAGKAYCN